MPLNIDNIAHPSDAGRSRRLSGRAGPVAMAVTLTLLLHLMLWQGLTTSWAAAPPVKMQRAVQVRQLDVAPPAQALVAEAPVSAEPAVVSRVQRAPAPIRTLRRASPDPTMKPAAAPQPDPVPAEAVTPAELAPAAPPEPDRQLAVLTAAAAAPASADLPAKPPVYPTRLPPPATLSYELRRGMLGGQGELRWQHDGKRYELRLEGSVPLFGTLLTQVSRGGFDSAGLAPERYTDRRIRRAEQAANFQRSAGVISFSGTATQFPLMAGAQDRVSWMVQLAAIAQAWHTRPAAGERVVMFIVGARADGDLWAFRVEGMEPVNTPLGSVQALKLMREPRSEHDTKVEVWLDPARHHLPVRARLSDASGDPLQLTLDQEIRTP